MDVAHGNTEKQNQVLVLSWVTVNLVIYSLLFLNQHAVRAFRNKQLNSA